MGCTPMMRALVLCGLVAVAAGILCEEDCYTCKSRDPETERDRCQRFCKDDDCKECDWCPRFEKGPQQAHWTGNKRPPFPPPPPGCHEWCNIYTCTHPDCKACNGMDCQFRCEPWCIKMAGASKCVKDGCEGCTECRGLIV